VQGELVNLDGFSLRLANLYFGYVDELARTPHRPRRPLPRRQASRASLDTGVYQQIGTATALGGSFTLPSLAPDRNESS
jgi:hypothetical protein